ncbi:MAG: response regulator transcription factor [Kordiimonadaceae bacterium]|nr:response regulator transcription factor [Kordiimonadaceae bacterium]MBT6329628.1 response regulator transcription factor [Kordiimonadaceae bacterium]
MMDKFKVILIDDEPPARDKLRRLLAPHDDFEIIGEADNGVDGLQAIEDLSPDVIFLDIQMPRLDGLSVASNMQDNLNTRIVFTTGYNEHALRAFKLSAIDYLLKPFDKQRFGNTLNRIRNHKGARAADNIPALIQDYRAQQSYPERMMLKTDDGIRVIGCNDIQWAEASGNYVKICLKDNVFIARQTLNGLQSQLDERKFVKIHRSHVVNVDAVSKVEPIGKGDYHIQLVDGETLRLSRGYNPDFFALFDKK